jgi:hypothetical protein
MSFVLSEAALVLVLVIEVPEFTMDRRIDFEHEHEREHEHENPNCRAKPARGSAGQPQRRPIRRHRPLTLTLQRPRD